MDFPQCDITLCSVDWLIPFDCLPTNKLFNSSAFVYWKPWMELRYTYISWRVVEAIGLTKILDQLMLPISTSNGWMDRQKYPKNRKWIRIHHSKALGCKPCLAFPGMRAQHLVCIARDAKGFKLHLTQEPDVTCPQKRNRMLPAHSNFIVILQWRRIEFYGLCTILTRKRGVLVIQSLNSSQGQVHWTRNTQATAWVIRGSDQEWPQALPWQATWQGLAR
jgi:hypothetical protein